MRAELGVSTLIKTACVAAMLGFLPFGMIVVMEATGRADSRLDITDFHAFYLVGQAIVSGHVAEVYDTGHLFPMEVALGGRQVLMPWSYPPPFGLLVAGLALMPLAAAYLAFTAGTLALYLWATARLAGEARWPVILASFVSIVLNLRCGQNGLLTAGIVALAAAALVERASPRAGVWLGAMVIKPHLVLMLPVWLALQRRWAVLAGAASVALALIAGSTMILGSEVLPAFWQSLSDVGHMMSSGVFPLYRMTSVFAFLLSLGVSPGLAVLLHGAVALIVLGTVAQAWTRSGDMRLGLGLAIMAGLFISPYVYDYDLPVFGVGLMLAAPALQQRLSVARYRALLIGFAAAQTPGFLLTPIGAWYHGHLVAPMGPLMLSVFGLIVYSVVTSRGLAAEATMPVDRTHSGDLVTG